MLKAAKLYEKELQEIYYNVIDNPKYKYISCNYVSSLEIAPDEWSTVQKISYKDRVIGFFQADICRSIRKISEVKVFSIAKTLEEYKVLEKDLLKFVLYLLDNFTKIEWSVIIGNPVQKKYRQFAEKVGGRVVGYYMNSCLVQGEYMNDERYELLSTPETKQKVKSLLKRLEN